AATASNLLSVTQSTSAYTGTALLVNVAAGSGTFASGNFLDLQKNSVSQFKVDNAGNTTALGSVTAVGLNAGTGSIQGTGGLTVTGNSTITGTLGGLTGLTVASGGATVTGNSTIAGTLGSLTGLTSSGSITFSGLSTAGIVTNTAAGVLGTTATIPVANGGTNIASYTTGDLLYASGATTLSKLADVATGSCLISGGVGVAASWGSCAGSVGSL